MHLLADGIPDDIDAPAPRKSACGDCRLIPIERTNASNSRENSAILRETDRLRKFSLEHHIPLKVT